MYPSKTSFEMGQSLTAQNKLLSRYNAHLVCLLDFDKQRAEQVAKTIQLYGYQVCCIEQLADLTAENTGRPDVLIIFLDEDAPADYQQALETLSENHSTSPIIFLSEQDNLRHRLFSARRGGSLFFSAPININGLIDGLDLLTAKEESEPYRVLIIDDDEATSEVHRLILGSAGMNSELVSDPMKALEAIESFQPELILMDIYMPECNGTELAKVLRQARFQPPIPLIYLSGEQNPRRQIEAIRVGGDDFLTKPVQPRELISTVTLMAKRYRNLFASMKQDPLTGFWRHSIFTERLQKSLINKIGSDANVITALLIVDELETINSQFGEEAGDTVLKNLARLIHGYFEPELLHGRFSGDTLAIAITDLSTSIISERLEAIRSAFATLNHVCGEHVFSTTVSVVMCNLTNDDPLEKTLRTARIALTAKHAE